MRYKIVSMLLLFIFYILGVVVGLYGKYFLDWVVSLYGGIAGILIVLIVNLREWDR